MNEYAEPSALLPSGTSQPSQATCHQTESALPNKETKTAVSLRFTPKIELLAVSMAEKTLQFHAQCQVTNGTQSIGEVIAHPAGKYSPVLQGRMGQICPDLCWEGDRDVSRLAKQLGCAFSILPCMTFSL